MSNDDNEPLGYGLKQVVVKTGLGRSTIYEEIRLGRLIARKARGRTIVLHRDLEAYLTGLPHA